MYRQEKLLNSNISSTCFHNMVNIGPLAAVGEFGAPQQISTGFASWLRYTAATSLIRGQPLCTMLSRLLGWYTIYTFLGSLAP